METTKYPNCAKGCNDGGTYPCDCAMPVPSAPACFKCDDLGYTQGNEVFNVARCDCPIGAKADTRAEKSSFTVGWGTGIMPGAPLLERVYDLIDEARTAGQVLTIDLVPLNPLAMGHYEMVADLRPARERAPSPSIIDMIRENAAVPEGRAIVTSAGSEPIVFDLWIGPQDDATRAMVGEALDQQDVGIGVYLPYPDGYTPENQLHPLKTMMHPDRRTEARKVIWPVPDPKNFTLERRDAFSTLTDEQFDKRQSDRRKREAK